MAGAAIIDAKNLLVVYNLGKPNEVCSLQDVNLEIYQGEYIIVFGPSGCGKSTLLSTLAGLQTPVAGEVMINGTNIFKAAKKEMVRIHQSVIGMVFQAFYLIPSLSIIENVCLPKVFVGVNRSKRKEDGMKLLRRFAISEHALKMPSQISGGQKQRVAIARALVNDPEIILADEPVGNLDSEASENVLMILKELNEIDKKTIILVTHNADHLHYADRIIYMKDGRIVDEKVNNDKRPKDREKPKPNMVPVSISNELKLLLRTFSNFSTQEVGGLMVPYKAKQLLAYLLSELKEEQMRITENLLKDLLFKTIDSEIFSKTLDADLNDGGAGWNKKKAGTFSEKVVGILAQAEYLSKNADNIIPFADYLVAKFDLKMEEETRYRFNSYIKLRIDNRIDGPSLRDRLDSPYDKGGVGLYKGKAEKVSDEVEMIMLMKYSGRK